MVDAFERIFHKELAERERRGLEQGRSEGEERGEERSVAIGKKRGFFQALAELVRDGLLSVKEAALRAQMTEAEFLAQMAAGARG